MFRGFCRCTAVVLFLMSLSDVTMHPVYMLLGKPWGEVFVIAAILAFFVYAAWPEEEDFDKA